MKVLALVLLMGLGQAPSAQTGISKVQIFDGNCTADSNVAEGPLDSDLNKRTSRFFCDTASITSFEDSKSHILINFSEKEAHHSPILGFSGYLNSEGDVMKVVNVYLSSGEAVTVSDGMCQLFFKDRRLTGLGCGMKVDETGRRTVALVAFDVTSQRR
jgi:hypothetical protein